MVYWTNSSAHIHHIWVHIQYIYAICTKLTAYSYSTNMHNWYLMTYAELQSSTSMLEALHEAINCWQTIHITYIHKVDVYEDGPGDAKCISVYLYMHSMVVASTQCVFDISDDNWRFLTTRLSKLGEREIYVCGIEFIRNVWIYGFTFWYAWFDYIESEPYVVIWPISVMIGLCVFVNLILGWLIVDGGEVRPYYKYKMNNMCE